jgi:hypothetical protein
MCFAQMMYKISNFSGYELSLLNIERKKKHNAGKMKHRQSHSRIGLSGCQSTATYMEEMRISYIQ